MKNLLWKNLADGEFKDENAILWMEVKCGAGFEVLETLAVFTKNGTILKLEKSNRGDAVNVWAKELIEKKLADISL